MGLKINLGCGEKIIKNFLNVDRIDYGQEIIQDVFIFLDSLTDNEADYVLIEHFLEHFSNDEVRIMLNELWRVTSPKGEIHIVVPHKDSEKAYVLAHKTFYMEQTFTTLTKDSHKRFGFRPWIIKEIITNDRPDIHCRMSPNKNEK